MAVFDERAACMTREFFHASIGRRRPAPAAERLNHKLRVALADVV